MSLSMPVSEILEWAERVGVSVGRSGKFLDVQTVQVGRIPADLRAVIRHNYAALLDHFPSDTVPEPVNVLAARMASLASLVPSAPRQPCHRQSDIFGEGA